MFVEETVQLAAFAKLSSCLTPSQQAVLLHDEGLADNFLGFYVALSIMVTNCSGERSFSKLALIKNYLKTTMNAKADGRSARRRPRFEWMDGVKRGQHDREMDVKETSERARNRNEW